MNILLGLALASPGLALAATEDAPALKTQKEKLSYSLGMSIGEDLRKNSLDVDSGLLIQGLKDALSGGKLLVSREEARGTLVVLQHQLMEKELALQADKNKKEGDAFLAANKTREGVVTLASGLQYKVSKTGDGKRPTLDDTVVVQYRGALIDGTEFDSSYKRKQPATIPLQGVIKGWGEALQLMPVGSKWQLFVPANLAYGERGAPRAKIGPNSTLIFEVELTEIKPPASAGQPGENSGTADAGATKHRAQR